MHEAVRLVIWDLDETFWLGTLSEGGIREYIQANHDLVITLAERGIVSSICSKNDHEAVKAVLVDKGLWRYFVMPNVNWEPKGRRVAAMVEAFQLRAATVLFIDDNPLNRAEVSDCVPGIQIADETRIGEMLSSPRFAGKDDRTLSRLGQYKLVEQRHYEREDAPDISRFLRESQIEVRFEYDVERHLDRAIELINRTNQLNFTKARLPDSLEAARLRLGEELKNHELRAALVGVKDRFGDHGWCGVYVLHVDGSLLHFAFSCRVLGMGVETWLYNRLGRPRLLVIGDVLVDVKGGARDVDWIGVDDGRAAEGGQKRKIERVVARGGCDLMPVAHYFGSLARSVVGEFNYNSHGLDARIDHSCFLAEAVKGGLEPAALPAAESIGYHAGDFQSALFSDPSPSDVWLLSFWTDSAYVVYRHPDHGFCAPYSLGGFHLRDARNADLAALASRDNVAAIGVAVEALRTEFEFVGLTPEAVFKQTLERVLSRAAPSTKVFVTLANEYFVDSDGVGKILADCARVNAWIEAVAGRFDNVVLLNIRDFVNTETETHGPFHFDRMVYFRLFQCMEETILSGSKPETYRDWRIHRLNSLDGMTINCRTAHEMSRTALFLGSMGRNEDAKGLARQAMKVEPEVITHSATYLQLAAGAYEDADRDLMEDALQSAGFPPIVLNKCGAALAEKKQFALARTFFAKAAEREPHAFHHRHGLANCLANLGDAAAAYEVLRTCLDDGDTNEHVMAHAARLLADLDRLEEASLVADELTSLHPSFPPGADVAAYVARLRTRRLEAVSG